MYDQPMGGCMAVFGAMTRAMRAQQILARAAIRTEVIQADATRNKGGCAYALSYPCTQEGNVRTILASAGVRVRTYVKNE